MVDEVLIVGVVVGLMVAWMIKLAFDLKSVIKVQTKAFNDSFTALEAQEKAIEDRIASLKASLYEKTDRSYLDQRLDSLMMVLSTVKKK